MAYATIAQAKEYIESYYSSTDTLRVNWEALSDSDKQVYLNRAERCIDQLPFKGRSLEKSKAFPREPDKEESLVQVKYATCELAIQQLNSESNDRAILQAQGVKSYKIGDLSETFKDTKNDYVDTHAISIVYPFLSKWLEGGFRICPTRIRGCCGPR
jgi:hypothetical protein